MNEFILVDNLEPNRPLLVNLANVTAINWSTGTLCIEYTDGTATELECEKQVFVDLASVLKIVKEIE